jgi:hypothetical protein
MSYISFSYKMENLQGKRPPCTEIRSSGPFRQQVIIIFQTFTVKRRKIRLIEGNAKCRYIKKLTCKGILRQVFICLRTRTPYLPSPPPFTQCIRVNSTIIHTGNWGRGEYIEPERRLEGQQFTKQGRIY